MSRIMITLTADGTAGPFEANGPADMTLKGTWGGGSLQIRRKDPDGTFYDMPGQVYTADTETLLDFPKDDRNTLEAVLTGATSPDLDIMI